MPLVHRCSTWPRRTVQVLLLALWILALLPAFAAAPHAARHHADPNALWRVVHDRCVPAARQGRMVAPCVQVALRGGVHDGYVVMKDRRGVAQYLLIPTARISGIESPALQQPGTANYLADAWRARRWVEKKLGRSMARGQVALAVNSISGRSQNQLHIHIDCIRDKVRRALDQMLPTIGDTWAVLPQRLAGHPYRAMRVLGKHLHADPFKLLARSLSPGQSMGKQTLVVVGQHFSDGRDGFLLLAGRSNLATGDWGGGEELLDHQCRIATAPGPMTPAAAMTH